MGIEDESGQARIAVELQRQAVDLRRIADASYYDRTTIRLIGDYLDTLAGELVGRGPAPEDENPWQDGGPGPDALLNPHLGVERKV